MPIFSTYTKRRVTGLSKIINRPPRENALAEISELLSGYEGNILEVPLEEVEAIARRHRINLQRDFYDFRKDIFRQYLRFCYKDYELDWDERKELTHLAGMLYLSPHDMRTVIGNERKRLYRKHTRRAAKDGVITEQEKAQLARLRKMLELDQSIASKIQHQVYTERYELAVKNANADKRITDEEMKILEFISGSMGLTRPHLDTVTFELFNRYRTYWLIENGHLPVFKPSTILRHGEQVHFKIGVRWLERKLEEYKNEPKGLAHRIRHASAYVFNHHNLALAHIPPEQYPFIESGEVQLTNKRIIFSSLSHNDEVPLYDILNVLPYANGIDIQKVNGRSPFLQFDDNIDLFSMTLNRLLLSLNK